MFIPMYKVFNFVYCCSIKLYKKGKKKDDHYIKELHKSVLSVEYFLLKISYF